MGTIKNIHGEQIKDLITKFFYRNNHLCFQILLHTEWNETIAFGEFSDYSEYKKAFNDLQIARTKKMPLNIPEKKLQPEVNNIKVA